ncbi:MAG: S53 family peptidase [Nakamurella sp.]
MGDDHVPLPGSDRSAPAGTRLVGPVGDDDRIEVTVVLRRRVDPQSGKTADAAAVSDAEPRNGSPVGTMSRSALAARFGADPADLQTVRRIVASASCNVLRVDRASRRVRICGTAAALGNLFGVTLQQSALPDEQGGATFRHHSGEISVPVELDGIVVAVLGLDARPQARPHFRPAPPVGAQPRQPAGPVSFTPPQLGAIYEFPEGTDGAGHVLAIIELGGGFRRRDLRTYFDGIAVPLPTVQAHGVDGAKNSPSDDPTGPDGEVMLDIEVAGALAPGALLKVYFAPNTDAGFLDAVAEASRDLPTPTAISISWGQADVQWTGQARTAMDEAFIDAALLGITVTVAAGDDGSNDRVGDGNPHVDFPASSPHVLACGGTSLVADLAAGAALSETVWNDGSTGGATGGGVSQNFALPAWQDSVGVPQAPGGGTGRGVPDVSAVADPRTGYAVLVDGQRAVYGGTSAVAPLWAALVCRISERLGRPLGLMQPTMYRGVTAGTAPTGFRDVTQGNNGAYAAGLGWDACTGLGVPIGRLLLTVVSAGPSAS